MKNFTLPVLALFTMIFVSCEEDEILMEEYNVAIPIIQSKADFRASISIDDPKKIEQSGKIYVYEDYIFVNDNGKGVHILDNSNFSPVKLKFLNIPGNTDIAIKGDLLYANSKMDLVIFDISDLNNIKLKDRVEEVFEDELLRPTENVQEYDFSNYNSNEDIVIGYTIETREREVPTDVYNGQPQPNFSEFDGSGTGGSMARFNISDNFLYVVGEYNLSVFDISNPTSPTITSQEQVGWQIETIFNKEGYLYLGSATGLYIYNIENPGTPVYASEIQHIYGCDPVVVQDDLAYVTIRGGNICGQEFSQLEIIDVSDKKNPQSLQIYEMESPYGLGVKDNRLFVCDGEFGLKIYDTSKSPELDMIDHFEEFTAYDVIPMENVLIMIGNNVLSQYSYKGGAITLINTFSLE
ncbi:hypothetical protein JM83_2049 [Gillisia sp. Hel_I_86]|uniref:LVIVD repeat-containing protein n=1 Tax=Gillisia sp. Hel_I_86 TaxID=1249981 RepID=UPI001199F14F|nr:hypothetical protein [Gillisia sp. Hel_I_86]TVZ27040.1 hypothetical protein JM83_2049 [Gillisia sp. Hel_I_86]